ncbi:MAG: ORF6N domain-containing protein [Bacteroidia bacterium]|nr:ORF6N domain-containing protein [Bacteroidota bacterium]MBP6513222.1 ORF6N domain-containing protein [Bacteroidia bacterium]
MANKETSVVVEEIIVSKIYLVRKHKVMLDVDLAELYGVETKVLKQSVKRNIDRFPDDFMFELTPTANNWLCPDSNCIMYQRADEVTGVAAVSLARLDGDAVSAYGEMADVQFVVNAAYTGNPTVTIPLSDYRAFDPVATPISLSPVDGIIQVTNTSVEEFSLIDGVRLFPNPTKSSSNILFNWKGNGSDKMSIRVLDLSGRMVGNAIQLIPQYGMNSVELDAESFAKGIYFIELRCNNESKVLKMLKY